MKNRSHSTQQTIPILQTACSIALGATLASLTSCSGGGGGSSATPATDPGPTVEETLQTLGVDTEEPPHVDESGEAYPEDYTPLGTTYELEKLSELAVLGLAAQGATDRLSLFDFEHDVLVPDQDPRLLDSVGSGDAAWVLDSVDPGAAPVAQRAGTSADIDGDGREEQVYAHIDGGSMSITVAEDSDAHYEMQTTVLFESVEPLLDVTVCTADVNADGFDEIVLGYSIGLEAQLSIVKYTNGVFVAPATPTKTFHTEYFGNLILLELQAGNIDYDGSEELAVVANEYFAEGSEGNYTLDALGCQAYVFDDAASGTEQLAKFAVVAQDDFGTPHTALCADLDIGDLDADGIAELVFAGVAETGGFCFGKYVMLALDDAVHGLADFGSAYMEEELGDEEGDTGCETLINWASIDLIDFEADHAAEVHVNEMIFADWRNAEPWTLVAEIFNIYSPSFRFDRTTISFEVGDFTGDIRQDLAVLAQGRPVRVWGIAVDDVDQELAVLDELPMEWDTYTYGRNPQLIAVNPDSDSTMIQFIDHTYLMTEPVIMAVLAAAPSTGGLGQNVDANSTEFGSSHSETSGSETQVSVSLSFILGTELLDLGNGWDIEGKITADYQHVWSTSETKTTSLSFASGPLEDTVICTVAPYDLYRYRVVSDPDPQRIGEVVQLFIPRPALTLQTEREFYNTAVGPNEPRVDSAVFKHTIGDLDSYPSSAKKDQLLSNHTGMQTGPIGVGQGAGSTTLGIAVAQESGSSDYLGTSAEFLATTTIVGVKIGGSIGAGSGYTWSRSVGDETSYSGTVGSIDAEHFPSDHYAFGFFCYWHDDEEFDQSYQVLNYWVE